MIFSQSLDVKDPKWRWMDKQIEEDFREFKKSGITRKMLDQVMKKAPEITFGENLIRFKIIDRVVYGQGGFAKHLLDTICEIYPVPDLDLIILEQDIIWNHKILPGPVLATCKIRSTTKKMIHFPVQLWLEWQRDYIPNIERASLTTSWERKADVVFWRGYNTDGNYDNPIDWDKFRRGKLCMLSKQYPHLINATFSGTRNWLVKEQLQESFFNFFPQHMASWEEYLNHKYPIDLDGCVASTPGFAWKLLSNYALMKHDSIYTLWFYKCLIPWVHYIPIPIQELGFGVVESLTNFPSDLRTVSMNTVAHLGKKINEFSLPNTQVLNRNGYIPIKEDLSDLLQKIDWARKNDVIAKQIALNGQKFARENLMPEHLYLYCYKVLLKYAKLQQND